jgi:hypothetical protein
MRTDRVIAREMKSGLGMLKVLTRKVDRLDRSLERLESSVAGLRLLVAGLATQEDVLRMLAKADGML